MHHSNKRVIRAFNRVCWFVPTFCFLILFAFSALADGTVSLLHAFPPVGPKGVYPWSTLIQGADGNFYGTTIAGGAAYAGTIFRVTPTGILSSMYSFTNGIDGAYCRSGLVMGSDGSFYGTANYGGSNGVGTVFKITTNGLFTPLYSFKTNGIDGQHPESALIVGGDGDFYGTTYYGGSNGVGTIYKITRTGVLTNLHTFTRTGSDGAQPTAPLILGTDGNFYGTTAYGGTRGSGTVFRMTTQGVWTNLHSFTNGSDGATPWAALVQGNEGNFYGTTYGGGTYGYGTVFKITPDGTLTPLHSFTNGSDGGSPYAALVQGANGNFYGTTHGDSTIIASTNSIGTVFEITSGGVLTTLYRFTNGIDGANPTAGLVLGTNGNFFGAAETGGVIPWGSPFGGFGRVLPGTSGWGTIFTITPDGEFTSLCAFPSASEGSNPGAGLIQATNGMFYGVTERGGTNDNGTVFQMSLDGTITPLYSFTAGTDGAVPIAALTQGSDGNFYGTTYGGGISNSGAIFKITAAGAFTVLHTFTNGIDGGHVYAPLIQGSNGNFYGTTSSGVGKNGFGTVFQITPTGVLTTLHTFTNGIDGAGPIAGLVQGGDGAFYGTTQAGGTNGNGTVFKITAAGALNTIYYFKGGVDGANPSATLTLGNDGNFYGICSYGGATDNGTVFKITASGILTLVYSFTGNNDGGNPQAPLILGTDGKFYGTTAYGGTNGYGSVFQITTNGVLTTLHYFDYLEAGPGPYAAVVQGTDGNFYIACEGAGPGYSAGTILRLTVPPVFLSMGRAGGGRTFTWSGQTGQKYQLQYNVSLSSTNWTNLGGPVTGVGPVLNATDPSPSGTQGFYRIIALP